MKKSSSITSLFLTVTLSLLGEGKVFIESIKNNTPDKIKIEITNPKNPFEEVTIATIDKNSTFGRRIELGTFSLRNGFIDFTDGMNKGLQFSPFGKKGPFKKKIRTWSYEITKVGLMYKNGIPHFEIQWSSTPPRSKAQKVITTTVKNASFIPKNYEPMLRNDEEIKITIEINPDGLFFTNVAVVRLIDFDEPMHIVSRS